MNPLRGNPTRSLRRRLRLIIPILFVGTLVLSWCAWQGIQTVQQGLSESRASDAAAYALRGVTADLPAAVATTVRVQASALGGMKETLDKVRVYHLGVEATGIRMDSRLRVDDLRLLMSDIEQTALTLAHFKAQLQAPDMKPAGRRDLARQAEKQQRQLDEQVATLSLRATETAVAWRDFGTRRSEAVSGFVEAVSLVATLVGVLMVIAVWATKYLMKDHLRGMQGITRVMGRLGTGDTLEAVPETLRHDELGDLARACQGFRENVRAVRQLAAKLQTQSALLDTVLDSLKDGLVVVDRNGQLLAWNAQYPALLQLPAEQLQTGMPAQALQALLPAQADARPPQTSTELSYPDGKVIEVRSSAMPDGGRVTLYSDVSERRAVEAQLRQAQKMEALGQLTGGVAHDFNNLLAAVVGNLDLLESLDDIPPNGRRFIRRAQQATDRGIGLTRRLLAFARRQPLSAETVAVDTLVHELADLIEDSAGPGINVTFSLAADDAWVSVDRGQLENVLLNLTVNGAAAMPAGGRLDIRTYRAETGQTAIEVADHGTGIPESIRDRIFEPFFTTRPGKGSGLGLSIVYGFIKQSGGDILLHSRAGRGTVFTILLPCVAAPMSPVDALALPSANAERYRVLVLEDDPAVGPVVAGLVRKQGHQAMWVRRPDTALQRLAQGDYDVLLSDVDLGINGNGVAVAAEVRQRFPQLRVLLMSGLPADLLSARFGLSPDTPVLQKPFGSAELTQALAGSGSADTPPVGDD